MRAWIIVAAIISLATLMAGCGDDDDGGDGEATTPARTPSGKETDGTVTLQEWAVVADPPRGPSGTFDFFVENAGPEETHELVIAATDLAAAALPTLEDGSVDKDSDELQIIHEVDDLDAGESTSFNLNLAAGRYILFCNLVDEDEQEVHYQLGMRTAFFVE